MRWLPALYVAFLLVLEPVTPVQWPVSFLLIAPARREDSLVAPGVPRQGVAGRTPLGSILGALVLGRLAFQGQAARPEGDEDHQ